MNPSISIIIPAYNEAHRIGHTLNILKVYGENNPHIKEIIVVNDGSTDDTETVVTSYKNIFPLLRFVSYEVNQGKGYAILEGMKIARAEYVLFTDADLSAPIEALELLLKETVGHDVVIGSRKVSGHTTQYEQPFSRRILSTLGMWVRSFFLVKSIKDTQCGFKLYAQRVLPYLIKKSTIRGFSFDMEFLVIAQENNFSITEVGIPWDHHGFGNFHPVRSIIPMLRDMFRIKRQQLSGLYTDHIR
jgi:dolichyl-phosphate beta-glucosyltransferase